MEWTDEVIEQLRMFWAIGHSTAEIGRRIGVSKNAIVGKAHRLGLTARPSPIKRGAETGVPRRMPARRPVVGPTLPPLTGPAEPVACHPIPAAPPPAVVASPLRPNAQAPGWRPVVRTPGGRVIACCWPIGEPGTPSFRFCDAASAAGKPYCSEHAALAYVKIRDRREDAA